MSVRSNVDAQPGGVRRDVADLPKPPEGLTILTGSVVALALVAQASEFDERFTTFALVLMPVVLFIGMSTLVRLVQNNFEDVQWVIGMNRIRHAYLEREPDLAPYFVTSPYDDETGVMTTLGATPWREQMRGTHAFVTTPGMLAVVNAVLAGVIAAMAASVAGTGPGIATVIGVLVSSSATPPSIDTRRNRSSCSADGTSHDSPHRSNAEPELPIAVSRRPRSTTLT